MSAGTVRTPVEPDLVRFGRSERVVHWATASLFLLLMLTGAALYAGPLSTIVGRRVLVRDLHVVAGIALPIPLLLGLVGRRGASLRADLGRLNRWSRDDRAWLRSRTRPEARLGKFNPGQKLNATFLGAAIVLMLGSGAIMKWFEPFPLGWRTGATFVHDWTALGIWLAVGAHVLFALRDPEALGAMRHGTVSARWAKRERPRWFEEDAGSRNP